MNNNALRDFVLLHYGDVLVLTGRVLYNLPPLRDCVVSR